MISVQLSLFNLLPYITFFFFVTFLTSCIYLYFFFNCFSALQIKGRTIRVDHVANYRPPKDTDDIDDVTKRLREEGCAPNVPQPSETESEEDNAVPVKKPKKGEERLYLFSEWNYS